MLQPLILLDFTLLSEINIESYFTYLYLIYNLAIILDIEKAT